jgi:hypothetical protein
MRASSPTLMLLCATLAGCGGGSSGGSASAAAAVTSGGATPVTSATGGRATPPAPPAARVEITPQGLKVDGVTRLLYGGEVQYFRIRDIGGDVARTHAMWEETLDRLVAADMNLVTTYVPWDVHEYREGQFDFTGERDLAAFLSMCHRRGLAVVIKPGPFINSEWPYGLGSFGAVPEWFKQKYPSALARKPDGSPFTTDLLGGAQGRQPSLFAPELLTATEAFFTQVAPIIRRFVHQEPCIVSVQVDNETNFYFGDRYASDYSTHGLAQYRGWLRAKYGAIADLNAAYGSSYATFDDVAPPRAAPGRSDPPSQNIRHQDWFDAGMAGIGEYHRALRAMWERLGVREPDVLFSTNDSPHTMTSFGRNIAAWHGPTKNLAGVSMLDAYPKQSPLSGSRPSDMPFLTAFFSDRFTQSNDRYAFAGGAPVAAGHCYAAELEGGLFSIPLINQPLPIPESATDHVLAQHLGRGSALAAVYVFRGGLNRDDTPYFSNAAVAIDGTPQARYDVLRRWGRVVRTRGDLLLASLPPARRVALVVDGRFDAPAGGIAGHPARAQVDEAAGMFGLLLDAGLEPAIVDLRDAQASDLAPYRLAFFMNPDVVHEDAARLLDGYVRAGGTLVNLLHTGRHDQAWRRGTVTESLLSRGLFSDGAPVGVFENTLIAESNINVRVPAGPTGAIATGPFLTKWRVGPGGTPIIWDRTFPFGMDGEVVGWTSARGAGTVHAIGTSLAGRYTSAAYFGTDARALLVGRGLVRHFASVAGAGGPLVSIANADGVCWARVVPGRGAFIIVQSRLERQATLHVDLHDLAGLGLSAASTYGVEESQTGAAIATGVTGSDLSTQGIGVPMGPFGTAVLWID